MQSVIVSALNAGTFYSPLRVDGIECSESDFWHFAGKTLPVEITEIGPLVKAGRTQKVGNNGAIVGTEQDTFRALVSLKSGESGVIKVRLHLCDLLPLLAQMDDKERKLTFGTYFPNGEKTEEERRKDGVTKYLVPTSPQRYTNEQIKEAITAGKIANLVVNA